MNHYKTELLPNGNLLVTIPIVIRQTAMGKRIECPEMQEAETSENRQAMLLAIARGRRWQKLIDDGAVTGAGEIAKATGRDESYVARIIRLATLSPEIVHAIIANEYPPPLSLTILQMAQPLSWEEQKKVLLGK